MTYLEGITNYENLLSQEEDLPVDSLLLDKQSLAYSSFAEDLKKGISVRSLSNVGYFYL